MLIAHNRRGEDAGNSAEAWLEWVVTEEGVQFGMLIDAADEVMKILRFHDRENCDPSEIAHLISIFVKNVMALFVDRGALKCGMTQMMIQHLSKQHTIFLNGGKTVKTIGSTDGVPTDVIDRCFTRMQKWTRLALNVVQAEWPAFEIVQATTILDRLLLRHARHARG